MASFGQRRARLGAISQACCSFMERAPAAPYGGSSSRPFLRHTTALLMIWLDLEGPHQPPLSIYAQKWSTPQKMFSMRLARKQPIEEAWQAALSLRMAGKNPGERRIILKGFGQRLNGLGTALLRANIHVLDVLHEGKGACRTAIPKPTRVAKANRPPGTECASCFRRRRISSLNAPRG